MGHVRAPWGPERKALSCQIQLLLLLLLKRPFPSPPESWLLLLFSETLFMIPQPPTSHPRPQHRPRALHGVGCLPARPKLPRLLSKGWTCHVTCTTNSWAVFSKERTEGVYAGIKTTEHNPLISEQTLT